MKNIFSLVICCTLIFYGTRLCSQVTEKPNFIFIVVDDLNDYVETFTDQPQIKTPNLLGIANSGTVFLNAYANATGCAPSRTSFLSGKDLAYTKVYNNDEYEDNFRDNFTATKNNEAVFTLPEILKDSGGYYTYAMNKVFHNPNENDFDKSTLIACEKSLSWNNRTYFQDLDSLELLFSPYAFDEGFEWGVIPDSLEPEMQDYIMTSSAVQFIHSFAWGEEDVCDKPFFLSLGFSHPHSDRYIPEKYYPEYFLDDIDQEPYNIPYNDPPATFPYNGIVMPPQPAEPYADYFALPENGIGRAFADIRNEYESMDLYFDSLQTIPVIDASLNDEEREYIIEESIKANYAMNYIAAVQFTDAQIGRVMEALYAYPDLAENTIIIVISDNGYALGEKRHWTKWGLWETDIRVPFIISDPAKPAGQVVKNVVTLLDLFPTVCDLAGVPYPVHSDGSSYLDGHSVTALLDHPDRIYESPAITSYRQYFSVGSCYPHHSIRNNRFHYIRYRENNDGTFATSYCDSSNVSFEEELYEIGENRDVDPFEWNNLIDDADYQPVVDYLEQWVPDSILYLSKTFTADIQLSTISCFAKNTDTLDLFCQISDTTGVPIAPPAGYTYRWTTNLTSDTLYGLTVQLLLNTIDESVFVSTDRLMIYFQMIENATGAITGFDLRYVYLNSKNNPAVSFNVVADETLTVNIEDYTISGSYNNTWWDFGDGHIAYESVPGPYTYNEPGVYLITNYISYGNGECVKTFMKNITLGVDNYTSEDGITCFPNPANNKLFVTMPHQADHATLTVCDIWGRTLYSADCSGNGFDFFYTLDVSAFKAGVYILVLADGNNRYKSPFVIAHQ